MAKHPGYTSCFFDYKTHEICLSFWSGDERVIERIPFSWHFFLRMEEYKEIDCPVFDNMVDDVRADGKWASVHMEKDWDGKVDEVVDWLRKRDVEPMEADLSPVNRFLTDEPVRFDSKPRILYYDLETDARAGWGSIPEHRILSIAWMGTSGRAECLVAETCDDEGEEEILTHFLEHVVSKHDLLVAWNGKKYDDVVLKARAKHLGMWPKWRMVNFLDLMLLFQHTYFGYGRDAEGRGVRVSYKLENIAQTVLGWGKLEQPSGAQAFVDLWREDKDRFAAYNMRDVEIMAALEKERGYIGAMAVVSHLCGRFLSNQSLFVGHLNDAFVLRYGAERGIRFPTRTHRHHDEDEKEKAKKYKGAFVLESVPGLYEGVTNVDFSALYANIIESGNISPETLVGDDYDGEVFTAPNGAKFRMDEVGIFPQIVRFAKGERKPFKVEVDRLEREGLEDSVEFKVAKQMSDAWKFIGNGSYGALGAPYLRYYSVECAEAVTLTGQDLVQLVLTGANERGLIPLAADTDGAYVKCWEEEAGKFCRSMDTAIDVYFELHGGKTGLVRLETSPSYERIFFTVKKRYAGIKVTGKRDVKGLELVRSDGCRYTREMQRRFIDYVLEAPKPDDATARMIVKRWRDALFAGDVPVADLLITQAINMPLDSYKANNLHVRVARKMFESGKEVYEGMKIPYVVTGTKDGRQRGVHLDDFDGDYDAKIYWKKVFPATQRILEAVFPSYAWKSMLKHDPNQGKMFVEE